MSYGTAQNCDQHRPTKTIDEVVSANASNLLEPLSSLQ